MQLDIGYFHEGLYIYLCKKKKQKTGHAEIFLNIQKSSRSKMTFVNQWTKNSDIFDSWKKFHDSVWKEWSEGVIKIDRTKLASRDTVQWFKRPASVLKTFEILRYSKSSETLALFWLACRSQSTLQKETSTIWWF